ncbi:GNAT family N-acetyltransferase [Candidatus Sororendozoicomonas aggregata]|uniref:GNAT family N-acetyltransferase n=1 Tax=Candidatus Sororendozoicomonas aggregata TaxID=3073239 RepID=UPI002ED2A86E
MSWSTTFVELDKKLHDRDSFFCGESALDQFLKKQAIRHMQSGISRTMVLPAQKPLVGGKYLICAFYSIAPGSIARQTLPDRLAKKLPRYPIPVFLLAQLAVHEQYKGEGLVKITLIKALEHLLAISAHMKAYAVIVDCLNDSVKAFYEQFGFETLQQQDGRSRLFLSIKTISLLFEQK